MERFFSLASGGWTPISLCIALQLLHICRDRDARCPTDRWCPNKINLALRCLVDSSLGRYRVTTGDADPVDLQRDLYSTPSQ